MSRAGWRTLEGLAVVFILGAGATTGTRYLSDHRINAYGDFAVYAARVACGQGLSAPGDFPRDFSPALLAFVMRQRESVSCADVLGDRQWRPASSFVKSQRNLIYTVAAVMRIGGLSWTALDRFMGGLFGLSMVLVYGLLRLTVWPALALIGVAALLCSNQIAQIESVRDFSKEPLFLAAWLTLGWILARKGDRASSALYLPACVGGALVGVGIGFRMDLMACLPVFPAVIALAVAGWDSRALRIKGLAIAGFFLAFGVTAMPTLMAYSGGSNSAHVAVLGLGRSFTVGLGLEPPVYDVGDTYSDGFAESVIAAHALVVQHRQDEAFLGSPEYDRQGFGFLADNAEAFPADQLVRIFAAVAQVIRYPFTEKARGAYLRESLFPPGLLTTLSAWRAWAFSLVDGYALLIAALALSVVFARDWRTGAVVTTLTLYFCGDSMIQFSRRHTFHFDVIPVNLLLITVQAVWVGAAAAVARWTAARRDPAPVFALARRAALALTLLSATAALIAGVLFATRVWQQRHVSAAFDRTLNLEWEPLESSQEPFAVVRDGVLEPTWYDVYPSMSGVWRKPLVLVRIPPSPSLTPPDAKHTMRWEYLRVDVGGKGCAAGAVPVALKYTGPVATAHWEYTRAFEIPLDGGTTVLFTPVLYRAGSSRFDGFVVPADRVSCIVAAYRSSPRATVPLPLVTAVLTPNWRSLPLYQRMAP